MLRLAAQRPSRPAGDASPWAGNQASAGEVGRRPASAAAEARDPLEQEADRVAAEVLAAPPRFAAAARGIRPGPEQPARPAAGSGAPLEPALREDMEQRFGHDFSQVRIHAGAAAGQSARALSADAYTLGQDIVFARDRYSPGAEGGRRLLAHELAHVVQQRADPSRGLQRKPAASPVAVDSPEARPADQVVRGVAYQPVWDAANQVWDFQDASGRSLYSSTIGGEDDSAEAEAEVNPLGSSVAQFWASVAAVGVSDDAKRLVDDAVATMLREQGPRLRELEKQIAAAEASSGLIGGKRERIRYFQAQRREIIAAYNPGNARRSMATALTSLSISMPHPSSVVPLQGPIQPPSWAEARKLAEEKNALLAPDRIPDRPASFSKYGGKRWEFSPIRTSVGDAYAYDLTTNKFQVANDLERIARAGYTEIHIATGTHGDPIGGLQPEFRFLREDARAIQATMERYSGLKVIPYNMADPIQAARFEAVQALAADGRLPGGATVAAHCYSEARVLDPNPDPAGPYRSVDLLDRGTPMSTRYLHGGVAGAAGALNIYDGLQDPNRAAGLAKIAGGSAQMVGGASYAAGYALDSARLARFGSRAATFGGYVTAPFAALDVHRFLQQKFEGPTADADALLGGTGLAFNLAGAIFPELALGAVVLEFGVKPVASEVSEYVAPRFIGGISELTGIPAEYLWRAH